MEIRICASFGAASEMASPFFSLLRGEQVPARQLDQTVSLELSGKNPARMAATKSTACSTMCVALMRASH
ncbi:hypothetical protein [Paraburkholderia tagetis]|uniref:Uncharacterized protein n=1 Tax=Paraburkholderia tagetis TaxID=2913261 RepID=A0A9X1RP92_9BURK|nr:hypothetical protein [Paraburkholderia tagetis]MCG5073437.1 hypothetical protein [Paraburkholderia tagetis]